MSESDHTTGVVRLRLAEQGYRLYRNQVGEYELKDGRYISTGLGKSSSDLVGYKPIVITQEMVGQTVAVFAMVEVKKDLRKVYGAKEKKRMEDQKKWMRVHIKNGAIGLFADEHGEHQL